MQLSDFLTPEHVACDVDVQSKKRALEQVSQLLINDMDKTNVNEVFDSLLARERLGATGIGHGIAIPHGRIKNCSHTTGALIRLRQGVDFDAVDNQPVDILFALAVPQESTDEHLQILSMLATMFSNEELRQKMRQAASAAELYQLILEWQQTH